MKKAVIMLVAVLMLLLSACANTPSSLEATDVQLTRTPEPVQAQTAEKEAPRDSYKPLKVSRSVETHNDDLVLIPLVEGENAEKINTLIRRNVLEAVNALPGAVYTIYRIEYNGMGIFSVLIYICDLSTDEAVAVLPLSFSTVLGIATDLSYYFDNDNDRWKRLIPDIITAKAEERDMVLLNEIMPLEDDQLFYITGDSLVLVYRLYEITTYNEGFPEFSIPVTQLADFMSPDSPLLRLIKTDDAMRSQEGD